MEHITRRQLLHGSIRLYEDPAPGAAASLFEVLAVAGEGGSTVAYRAVRRTANGPVKGILKEFYPLDAKGRIYYSLRRTPAGQLVAGAGTSRTFHAECRRFLGRYRLVNEVIATADSPLRNYIEQGQPFFGRDPEAPATVYVFSPSLEGVGFDRYLAGLQPDSAPQAEQALLQILQTVHTLTDAVKAMHTDGLLHLDLKPSNFLAAVDSDGRLLPGHLSLFDINTVRSVLEEDALDPVRTGSPGYCAPELETEGPSDRSDLYSLGAILFRSIVLCPQEVPDGLYRPGLYGRFEHLLRTSRLFACSDVNSDPLLCSRLASILEKTLAAGQQQRYNSLSELKQELERCIERIRQLRTLPTNELGATDPQVIFQKLLYQYPLYRSLQGSRRLEVLVLGAGAYAQGFIDAVLQAGQNGFAVRVTAVSAQPESDREAYLRFRPMLEQFVTVEGRPAPEYSYAALRFVGLGEAAQNSFSLDDDAENRRLLHQLLHRQGSASPFRYCFVSLGVDTLNSTVAQQLAAQLPGSPVFYAKSTPAVKPAAGLCRPVWIREPLTSAAAIAPQLEQMAFNTHLGWLGSNYNLEAVRKKFFDPKDRYNYTSSLASALAIPYRLFHLGLIDADAPFDPQQAARRFQRQILDKKDTDPAARQTFDRLVWYEHRRWVIEKVCQGWQAPLLPDGTLDLDRCVYHGLVKDEANRLHPCLQTSLPAAPLSTPAYRSRERWDSLPLDPALDPLDRMSVQLHRAFARRAEELLRTEDPLRCDALQQLRALAADSPAVLQAFCRFEFALKQIIARSESYSRHYADYAAGVLQAAHAALPADRAARTGQLLKAVKSKFFPLIEANLYRDYKANDQANILRIPYILTNRPLQSLGLAFSAGGPALPSVASAALLNPASLTWLCCFTAADRAAALQRRLCTALEYLCKRQNHCAVRLTVACTAGVPEEERTALRQTLQAAAQQYAGTRCRLTDVLVLDCADVADCVHQLTQELWQRPVQLFDCSAALLPGADPLFFDPTALPGTGCFALDAAAKTFSVRVPSPHTDFLYYLQDDSFLRVEDALALLDARAVPDVPDYSIDIEGLWQICTTADWAQLCGLLAHHLQRQPPLARLTVPTPSAPLQAREWYLPGFVLQPLRRLLPQLARAGLIRAETVEADRADTCRLSLTADAANLAQLDRLFAQPHLLLDYYHPQLVPCGTADYLLRHTSLEVTDLPLPAGADGERCFALLQTLCRGGYLHQLCRNEAAGTVRFAYSTPRMEALLCRPAEVFLRKLFLDALHAGQWNDLAVHVAVRRPGDASDHTFDLVLCSGFGSLLCRCSHGADANGQPVFRLEAQTAPAWAADPNAPAHRFAVRAADDPAAVLDALHALLTGTP